MQGRTCPRGVILLSPHFDLSKLVLEFPDLGLEVFLFSALLHKVDPVGHSEDNEKKKYCPKFSERYREIEEQLNDPENSQYDGDE
jgi:hypothetical protein